MHTKSYMLHIIMAYMLFFVAPMVQAQTSLSAKELEDIIKDGHSYFYFEEYEEALPLYMQALAEQPNNANLHYLAGFCYLHIAGRKYSAIAHLEQATQNMTRRHRPNSATETKAPIDALFY